MDSNKTATILAALIVGILSGPYITGMFQYLFPNSPPSFADESLRAAYDSPRPIGSDCFWVAAAADPDGDKIFYKFNLKNADTGVILKTRGWDTSSYWIFDTNDLYDGNFVVEALVKDGYHATNSDFDDSCSDVFTLISGWPIMLTNSCDRTVKFILRYKSPSEGWVIKSWELDPGSTYLGNTDNERIRTDMEYVYYYASTLDNELEWRGNYVYEFLGNSVLMRKTQLTKQKGTGVASLNISCP